MLKLCNDKGSSVKQLQFARQRGATPLAHSGAAAEQRHELVAPAFSEASTLAPATIPRLQNLIGNHAVQRLIAAQRRSSQSVRRAAVADETETDAAGGATGLTSPRFAGDAVLEACFADQARLSEGMSGAPVRKVQQALVDLGFDLGAAGADGIYGLKTASAVRQFKATHRLGFEQFGDVGPGTMRKLDTLFAGAPDVQPIPEEAADEETGSCPTDDDIVTALESRPAQLEAFADTAAEELTTAPTVGAGAHVGINEAVKRFKEKVSVSDPIRPADKTNVTERGQFFWSTQFTASILDQIDALRSVPGAADFADKAFDATVAVSQRDAASARRGAQLIAELRQIAATTTSPGKSAMLALVKPAPLAGGVMEALLWSSLNKRADNTIPPELASFRSIPALSTLKKFDRQGCGTHAITMANRLKQKGGIVPRNTAVRPFSATLTTGVVTRDFRPLAAVPGFHRGDTVRQTGGAAAAAQMRQALDAGQVVHARVLSGVGIGSAKVPPNPNAKPATFSVTVPEEHSLLIIGFDSDAFVFSDPDAAVSHHPEHGFGLLFLSGDRLSTAPADIPASAGVNEEGKHVDGEKRYQVLTLSSL
jgi:peptidoglycan hydrolase-like protein with peptidoglycan-binding domain